RGARPPCAARGPIGRGEEQQMAVDQPTVRAQEALAAAASLAEERGHQAVEPEHLLLALLDAREGVVEPVLERAGADMAALRAATLAALERRPVVRGATQQHISPAFRHVLRPACRGAERLRDEYISTKRLLMGPVGEPSPARDALASAGVAPDGLLAALQEVRGSHRVTDPNPEDKYQALERYGRDLTDLARRGKLD